MRLLYCAKNSAYGLSPCLVTSCYKVPTFDIYMVNRNTKQKKKMQITFWHSEIHYAYTYCLVRNELELFSFVRSYMGIPCALWLLTDHYYHRQGLKNSLFPIHFEKSESNFTFSIIYVAWLFTCIYKIDTISLQVPEFQTLLYVISFLFIYLFIYLSIYWFIFYFYRNKLDTWHPFF